MAIRKSQLYSSLWSSCDELRGGMDASQYKDYVLTLLFMKYVSDKYAGKPGAVIDIPKGGSFADMVKLKGNKEIGEKITQIKHLLLHDLTIVFGWNRVTLTKEKPRRLLGLPGPLPKVPS